MINRTILRIKILQILFASQSQKKSDVQKQLNDNLKLLHNSIDATYNLYVYLLYLISNITSYAEQLIDERKNKLLPTEEERNPNMRFVQNKFALQIQENIAINEYIEKTKFSWKNFDLVLKNIYETIVAQDFYKEYMSKENSSYEEDKELWRNIFKSCFYDNEFFEEILENYSIHWTDNLAIVLTFVIKTIKFFDDKNGANQEILPQYQTLDTLSYANELYKDTVLNEEKYLQLIDKQTTAEWDIDRISLMDKTILQIALAEICTFPTIPIQVSINEYVELTKIYSDEKNAKFVNGVLDKISKRLLDEGSITKVKLVK
ncbi:MAG: transcription antitermination factor NusB [Paludibacteraceae bacterium]|nr:transcription antitermination factor NusB [Paludibacteraceae bacterium]